MLLTVGIVVLAGCGDGVRHGPMEHETKVLELDKSELTRAEIKIGADLRGNPQRSYDVRINGGVGQIDLVAE